MNHFVSIVKGMKDLKRRAETDPLSWFRPTPPQHKFLSDPSKFKLLLGGNQVGKSICAAYCLVSRCLGRHEYLKTDPPPIEAALICHSAEQSRTMQGKLYDMIPKDELHPECEFIRGKGFRGLSPVVRFKNGSIIRIKSAGQNIIGLASMTLNLCVIDEPISADIFNELLSRVLRGGAGGKSGTLAITMTPVGEDVQYLRELVEKGKCSMTRAPLTVEDTTPMGLKPLLTQKQIDTIAEAFLPIDREARLTGSWDVGVLDGRVFENFSDDMISSSPVPSGGEYIFSIGIDHGTNVNSEVATLTCIDIREIQKPRVYVLGEYIGSQAPPEHHARGILEMLKKYGVDPGSCKWTGDAAHMGSRGNRDVKRMSNIMLMRAFESILGYPPRGLPWTIRTAKKHKGSIFFGASVIHSIMSRKHFWIRPECQRTILSLKRWTIERTQSQRSRNQWGHCVDSLRYAIIPQLPSGPVIPIPQIRVL
jgi:hypothetical protein